MEILACHRWKTEFETQLLQLHLHALWRLHMWQMTYHGIIELLQAIHKLCAKK